MKQDQNIRKKERLHACTYNFMFIHFNLARIDMECFSKNPRPLNIPHHLSFLSFVLSPQRNLLKKVLSTPRMKWWVGAVCLTIPPSMSHVLTPMYR